MRILQIVADGNPGGGTTCVLQLVEDLINAGHEVHFVCQTNSYAEQQGKRLGAIVHRGIDFFRSRMDATVAYALKDTIHEVFPQVVHLHGGRAAFFAARGGLSTASIKSVYTVHGYHFLRKRQPLRWLAQMAERKIAKHVCHTVFVSEYDRRVAERLKLLPARHPHRVIYNGVEAGSFVPSERSAEQRRRIAAVGRLTFQKIHIACSTSQSSSQPTASRLT